MSYLVIDLSTSSGRINAVSDDGSETKVEEIVCFRNEPLLKNGFLTWDLFNLSKEILSGLNAAKNAGYETEKVTICGWASDYVLLDKDNMPLVPILAREDEAGARTAPLVHGMLPYDEIFARTGIQYDVNNSLYRLCYDNINGKFEKATDFMMIPEYLGFLLTGKKVHERSICATSGLINPRTGEWEETVIHELGLPEDMFEREPEAGPVSLGQVTEAISEVIGWKPEVLLGNAYGVSAAVNSEQFEEDTAFVCFGEEIAVGVKLETPIINGDVQASGFSNEADSSGINFVRNLRGLSLLQRLRRELNESGTLNELAELGRKATPKNYFLELNAEEYGYGYDLRNTISVECEDNGVEEPEKSRDFVYAVISAMAAGIAVAVLECERLTGRKITRIRTLGRGNGIAYLNELVQKKSGKKVEVGSKDAVSEGVLRSI